ncbi:MAG: HNH endonuclease [Candidatus Hodarchaeota archaeon]
MGRNKKETFRGPKVTWHPPYCLVCEREFKNKASLSVHLRNSPKHRMSWKKWVQLAKKYSQFHHEEALDFHFMDYPIHPILVQRMVIYPPSCGYCIQCGNPLTGRQRRYCSKECREVYHDEHNLDYLRAKVTLRQNFHCALCGENYRNKDFELDHTQAICLGGDPWDPANHQALCKRCHDEKSRRDMHELRTGFKVHRLDNFFMREVET